VKYVLDTNAVSALMRGDESMIAHLRRVVRRDVGIPQPAFAEVQYGIERLSAGKRRDRLRARLTLLQSEIVRLPWTDEVSERFGRIKRDLERRGERLEDFDVAIAAHAHTPETVLVTHDQALSTRIAGLEIEDWSMRPGA
jgi:tRNA(fMet)-specific endonuclease VapC